MRCSTADGNGLLRPGLPCCDRPTSGGSKEGLVSLAGGCVPRYRSDEANVVVAVCVGVVLGAEGSGVYQFHVGLGQGGQKTHAEETNCEFGLHFHGYRCCVLGGLVTVL